MPGKEDHQDRHKGQHRAHAADHAVDDETLQPRGRIRQQRARRLRQADE